MDRFRCQMWCMTPTPDYYYPVYSMILATVLRPVFQAVPLQCKQSGSGLDNPLGRTEQRQTPLRLDSASATIAKTWAVCFISNSRNICRTSVLRSMWTIRTITMDVRYIVVPTTWDVNSSSSSLMGLRFQMNRRVEDSFFFFVISARVVSRFWGVRDL
jgi:hypothetical protein